MGGRLCITGHAGHAAVRSVLSGERCKAMSSWRWGIWEETLPALHRLAQWCLEPPLGALMRRSMLDALTEVANERNRFRKRVGVLCFFRLQDQEKVVVKFDFKCPRGRGILQALRGIPSAYMMRHNTDDLTLTCSRCGRYQIEEDTLLFHCPRFGCNYDLCLVCAEGLVRHRHARPSDAETPACET